MRFSNATTPPRRKGRQILFSVELAPQTCWHCCVDFVPVVEGKELPPLYRCRSFGRPDNDYERKTQIFMGEAATF